MGIDRRAAAREAFARQDWKQAYAALSVADEGRAETSIDDLERLAVSAYMLGKDEASADFWTRAHAESLRRHDVNRAVRCAFWLVLDLLTRGEDARAGGWLARATHLLDQQPDCAEQGLLLALIARTHVRRGDIDRAHEAASSAIGLARRFDDAELQVFGRLSLAQVTARRGERSRRRNWVSVFVNMIRSVLSPASCPDDSVRAIRSRSETARCESSSYLAATISDKPAGIATSEVFSRGATTAEASFWDEFGLGALAFLSGLGFSVAI
jgi:hypothetical protein